jgi:FKBP-type peptidyl-prolyl cis-trans isomerase
MKTPLRLALLSLLWIGLAFGVSAIDDFSATPEGVQFKELQIGEGERVNTGDVAVMHFVGWLAEDGQRGREIFNTRQRGKPVSFVVGTEKVMPGWNAGVLGMRSGGRRLLLVPPGLAFGPKGVSGVVPANASLMFLIELVSVEKAQ